MRNISKGTKVNKRMLGKEIDYRLRPIIQQKKYLEQDEKELEEAKEIARKIDEKVKKKRNILTEMLQEQIEGQDVGDIQTREAKEALISSYRNLWKFVSRDDEQSKTALAVVHGIIERTDDLMLQQAENWLWDIHNMLLGNECEVEATILENEARSRGLNVLDPERDAESILAMFGVVSEIEEGEARLSMSIPDGRLDPKAPLWENIWIPLIELPEAYTIENVWIAWVERTYFCHGIEMKKGRFEPGSYSRKELSRKIESMFTIVKVE